MAATNASAAWTLYSLFPTVAPICKEAQQHHPSSETWAVRRIPPLSFCLPPTLLQACDTEERKEG